MMDENQTLSSQIMDDLNQYPILKTMISCIIENTILIEKLQNILSLLKFNPLVRSHIKSNLNFQVPFPMNNQKMDPNQMIFPNQMMLPNQMMNPNLMMNPNQTMLPNQKFFESQSNENEYINVTFRTNSDKGKNSQITIQCSINEKVSDLIEKYRNETGDRDNSKKFIYDARALNPSLTLLEAGMQNNSNVFVVVIKGVKGG